MPFIIIGNPVDGFEYVGPFDTTSEAVEWATNNVTAEWWETSLTKPENFH